MDWGARIYWRGAGGEEEEEEEGGEVLYGRTSSHEAIQASEHVENGI